ncbi:hypothetical protein [Pseudarthrobacter siccitolerans]|uniref:hypothetical protein n=1 Tax=Pseudarthrobacter siccitolerans TaxID=861266 RepID=UPI000678D6B8|nr:hypothetical protein [Pseudarthrobacter siccitolerans]
MAAVGLLVSFGAGRLVDGWVRPGGFGSFWFDPDALRCVFHALACSGGHSATTEAPEWDHNEPR